MDGGAGSAIRDAILDLQARINQDIIGQERVVERLVIALLANGNVLLEGLPGLAKTRAIKSLSQEPRIGLQPHPVHARPAALGRDRRRDLPQRRQGRQFEFRKGPIFGNLVLADEINRAPAKVQSALLEAMEERQVTVAGKRYKLPDLFMVLATQNPIEQEGTYPLPEAQMDRFLMHVRIDYPSDARRGEGAAPRARASRRRRTKPPAPPPKIPQKAIFDARARDRPRDDQGGGRDLYGGADRRDAPAGRVRRQAQGLDRDRRQPARLARPRPLRRASTPGCRAATMSTPDGRAGGRRMTACATGCRLSYEAGADGVTPTA